MRPFTEKGEYFSIESRKILARHGVTFALNGSLAELANALDSKPSVFGLESSTLSGATN